MPSLLNAILGNNMTDINNETIANDMLAGSKGAATAYLTAALESATPEVRRMFMQYSNQAAQSHEAITALAVQKGWYKPYDAPSVQLSETYKQSESVVTPANQ